MTKPILKGPFLGAAVSCMLLRGVQNNNRCMLGLLELLKVAFQAVLRGVVHIILCYVNQQLQEQCTFSPQSLGAGAGRRLELYRGERQPGRHATSRVSPAYTRAR